MKTNPDPPTAAQDEAFMHQALVLAGRGLGRTWPNPAVGCVLVNDGHIVARGWTQPTGRPHAEAVALQRAGDAAEGATAYVSLEPCAHTGKTPPCADALVGAGIRRCVVACRDPDPRTAGKGIGILRAAGIDVVEAVLQAQAETLNRGFILRQTQGRPLFALKIAVSKDGAIAAAPGTPTAITGPTAKNLGHLLRARHDAVLFGIGTQQADDPEYTCRLPGMADQTPVRVLLDSLLSLDEQSRLLTTATAAPLWIVVAPGFDAAKAARLKVLAGVTIMVAERIDENGRPDLGWLAGELAARGLTRVLVETGATLNRAIVEAGLVDALHLFTGPKELGAGALKAFGAGGPGVADVAQTLERVDKRTLGGDTYGYWINRT